MERAKAVELLIKEFCPCGNEVIKESDYCLFIACNDCRGTSRMIWTGDYKRIINNRMNRCLCYKALPIPLLIKARSFIHHPIIKVQHFWDFLTIKVKISTADPEDFVIYNEGNTVMYPIEDEAFYHNYQHNQMLKETMKRHLDLNKVDILRPEKQLA